MDNLSDVSITLEGSMVAREEVDNEYKIEYKSKDTTAKLILTFCEESSMLYFSSKKIEDSRYTDIVFCESNINNDFISNCDNILLKLYPGLILTQKFQNIKLQLQFNENNIELKCSLIYDTAREGVNSLILDKYILLENSDDNTKYNLSKTPFENLKLLFESNFIINSTEFGMNSLKKYLIIN